MSHYLERECAKCGRWFEGAATRSRHGMDYWECGDCARGLTPESPKPLYEKLKEAYGTDWTKPQPGEKGRRGFAEPHIKPLDAEQRRELLERKANGDTDQTKPAA